MPTLDAALRRLAGTPVLLVATDFDGTLAPIVQEPDKAAATPRCRRALATLIRQFHTRVAVISGRSLVDLERRLSVHESELLLVGSHGSEFEPDLTGRMSHGERELLARIRATVDAAADGLPGITVEHKDASVTLHYRAASRGCAAEALWRLRRSDVWSESRPWIHRGKKVVELAAIRMNKGAALMRLRRETGCTAFLYIGDDRTDEDVFGCATADDVTVKVGRGATAARYRVDDPDEVADLLARLADLRHRALRESTSLPIADMGFISDQRTGALVTPRGEICWLCPRRFDGPAMFASLLGGPSGGFFAVGPDNGGGRGHQRYLGDSLVLETRWPELTVVDYIDGSAGGRGSTVIVREVRPRTPGAACHIAFAPHLDFARMDTELVLVEDGVRVLGARDPVLLHAPGVPFTIEPLGRAGVARATVTLDQPLRLVLTCGRATRPTRPASDVIADWTTGLDSLKWPTRWTTEVRRSVVVLRGLIYQPSGAMVAALTTSLPESIGYERNWDYRYCWIRDAALACNALVRLGSLDEARALADWLSTVIADGPPGDLHPLYGVEGERILVEAELRNLIGYGGSQPVRVGNAAAEQLQIDVFGVVVEFMANFASAAGTLTDRQWRVVEQMVRAVADRWSEPDSGIWEHRHAIRHHVHSKVMCWTAVEHAIALAKRFDRPIDADWPELSATIRDEVIARGWSDTAGSFTVAYDSDELDAAALVAVLSGLVDSDDARAIATVEAVRRELSTGHAVYRYKYADGFSGTEGAFHLCTSWLVEALAMTGRIAEAEDLFTHLVGAMGATGLLSEQIDTSTGTALGNVPQAYSHTGVIAGALALNRAAGA